MSPEEKAVFKLQLPDVLQRIESGETTKADADWVEDLARHVLENQ